MSHCRNRILVVSEIFWPEGGGAELATYLILGILRKAGCKITVVTGTRKPALIDGVKYYYTGLLGHWNRVKRSLNTWLLTRESWFLNLLREHDILYLPLMAYPTIPLAKKLGLRVIVHLHNYVPVRYHGVKYYFEPDRLNTLEELKWGIFHELHANESLFRALALPISYKAYRISRRLLEQADNIICVSKRQAQIISELAPELRGRITVIYNPPPKAPNIEKRPSEKPTFLYSGGGSIVKGFPIILNVLKELGKSSRRMEARFVFTNTYTEQQIMELQNLRKKYGLNIEVLGRISYENILKLHSESWTLLFPSIWEEPLPYSVVESMLLGTIPIASRVGGILEILENTGFSRFSFEPGNLSSFIEAITTVAYMDSTELLEIGRDLRKHILKTLSNTEESILALFTN